MAFVSGCVRIIVSRWRHSPLLIALILLNIACGLCIMTFFVNIGVNMSSYVEREFFSSERIRHILVKPVRDAEFLPAGAAFLSDPLIETSRVFYAVRLPASVQPSLEGGEPSGVSVGVLFSRDAVFEGEPGYGSAFVSTGEGKNWREGLVVSERALEQFSGGDPIGELIGFEFGGNEIRLPVTAVISAAAESCYDPDCLSDAYWFAPEVVIAGMSPVSADLRVKRNEDVEIFISGNEFRDCVALSDIGEVKRLVGLSTARSLIIGSCGVLFALFCSIGIAGSLSLLQEKARRSSVLLSTLGFTGPQIVLADLLEGLMLSLAASALGMAAVILLARLPNVLSSFQFASIDAGSLSDLNAWVAAGCCAGFLVLVEACRLRASRSARRDGYFETMRNER